jgi:NAD(P)-dependent dehydrogenase (short-subunit alcohol dehydrogenase family)
VLLLCSDEAAYVTGADIPVDGGWSIGDPPGVLPGTAA